MKKLIIIAAILAIGGGFYAYREYNRGVESTADIKSDVTISANELLTAFQTNEEEANAKFLDKVVEVTGEVGQVEVTGGKTIVRLNAGDSMSGVTCEMEGTDDVAFNKGEQFTFKCTCSGLLMDVVLVRCVRK